MQNGFGLSQQDIERKSAIQDLKTRCVAISRLSLKPVIEKSSLSVLRDELQSLLPVLERLKGLNAINQPLADYIFFPLSYIFRQYENVSDRVTELALQCLKILLDTAWNAGLQQETAKQFLVFLTTIVGGTPGQTVEKRRIPSEECKTACILCLHSLFVALKPGRPAAGVLKEEELVPILGHTVFTLLETLEAAESSELQQATLRTCSVLLEECLELDAVVAFFPGTVSQLVKYLNPTSQTRRQYRSLAAAIQILAKCIKRVLADNANKDLPESSPEEGKIVRSKAWLKATAGQVKLALEGLAKLRSHAKVQVRQALFELCRDLLDSCSESLSNCVPLLVESLVVFAGDEDETLSRKADTAILFASATNAAMKDSLQESVHNWIVSLPRVMQSNDEDAKARLIRRISVGFRLMGTLGLDSEVILDLLGKNVMDSLQVIQGFSNDDKQVITLPDTSEVEGTMALVISGNDKSIDKPKEEFPDVIMPHKSQEGTLKSMKELLKLMGSNSESAASLVEWHLQRISNGAPGEQSVSLWISLNLLRGLNGDTPSDYDDFLDFGSGSSSIYRRLTDELLSVSIDILSSTELPTAHTEKLQCLALESVALVAKSSTMAFRETFVETLYPIAHLLGSASPLVQRHAIIALNIIASSTDYSSAKDLIVGNSDYLLNAISLKLSLSELSPQAPLVLRMLLKISGSALIPHLDDVVSSIFSALDSYHGYTHLVTLMFSVLEAICEEGARSLPGVIPEKAMIEKRLEESGINPLKKEDVIDMFTKAFTRKPDLDIEEIERIPHPKKPWGPPKDKFEKDPFDLDQMSDTEEDETSKEIAKKEEEDKPSKTYSTLLRIVQLTPHYLSSPSAHLRARLLSLLTTTIPALATRETDFLPAVHLTWPLICARLCHDPDANVRYEAARTVRAVCIYAGSFVRTRIRDGWSVFRDVLVREKRLGVMEGFVVVGAEVNKVVEAIGVEEVRKWEGLRKAVCRVGGWVIEPMAEEKEVKGRIMAP